MHTPKSGVAIGRTQATGMLAEGKALIVLIDSLSAVERITKANVRVKFPSALDSE